MENVELVSIYIPTKNRVSLLEIASDSVLAQTHKNLELIIVNDGSSDETSEFLEELRKRDPRVVVLQNQDSIGAPASRNRAILAATGEFVTGLDDDDQFHPNRIKAFLDLWKVFNETDERFAFLYSQDVVETGGARSLSEKTGGAKYHQIFVRNFVGNQIFARKETYIKAGLFDIEMPAWQDLDLIMRVLKTCGEGRLLDAGTYVFNNDPRLDRISLKSGAAIRKASHRLVAKNAEASSEMRQAVLLQVFGDFYLLRPTFSDVFIVMRHGFYLRNFLRLCKALLRRDRRRA